MRKKKKESGQNLKIAFWFGFFVFLLIAGSLLFKFILLLKSSKFDGAHRFNIYLSCGNMEDSIVSFSPENQSIVVLNLKKQSMEEIRKNLEVPIDDIILVKDNDCEREISSQLAKGFFGEFKKTSLTTIDILRLWLFSKFVSSHSITTKDLSGLDLTDNLLIDKIINGLFSDLTITSERLSIQIVNGTGISGLGNRLARLITNMGGEVVAINTSEKELSESKITYFDKNSYTAERLGKILSFKILKKQESGVSDIVIEIGKDKINFLPF